MEERSGRTISCRCHSLRSCVGSPFAASFPSVFSLEVPSIESGFLGQLDEGVDPRLHVVPGIMKRGEVIAPGERNDQVHLGAVADLGETLSLGDGLVLLQV